MSEQSNDQQTPVESGNEHNRDTSAQDSGVSRREWLMTFGSAVILSGFRDLPGFADESQFVAKGTLPPGLYEPSLDHLTHALAGEARFVPIPAGTETEYTKPRSAPFAPKASSPGEFQVIRRLVEIILGEHLTDSAQKSDQGGLASVYDEVAEWIDLVVSSAPGVRKAAQALPADQRALTVAYFGTDEPVRELETFEPERVCREGFSWLNAESQRRSANAFLAAAPALQIDLVRAISDVRTDKSVTHAGTLLFGFLKAECIRGFYTSRLGLKELDYKGNAFYGQSPGCGLTPQSTTKTE